MGLGFSCQSRANSSQPEQTFVDEVWIGAMQTGRRGFLHFSLAALAGAASRPCAAQQQGGMGGRIAAPQKKPTESGLPFEASFTDVAASAGLTAPVIYGAQENDVYILEANGCGCAFFD